MINQQSEVALLMARIRSEYESCQQALHSFAQGTAKHEFMTAKTERMAQSIEELRQIAGDDVVKQVLTTIDEIPDRDPGTQEEEHE